MRRTVSQAGRTLVLQPSQSGFSAVKFASLSSEHVLLLPTGRNISQGGIGHNRRVLLFTWKIHVLDAGFFYKIRFCQNLYGMIKFRFHNEPMDEFIERDLK